MSKNKSLSNTDSRGGGGLSLVFFLFGSFLFLVLFVSPLGKVINARDWNETSCLVISNRVKTHKGRGETYSVDIVYSYEINGKKYRSNRYHFMVGITTGFRGKAAFVNRYPPGTKITCYVNPWNPRDAVIERGFTPLVYLLVGLFIPLIFMLIGLLPLFNLPLQRPQTKKKWRRTEEKKSSWQVLAASEHLIFVPGKSPRHKSYITGTYRHHRLKLEIFRKYALCTRLAVSVDKLANGSLQNDPDLPGEQVARKDAISLLTPTSPHYILKEAQLKGSIAAQTVDQIVHMCYEQNGIENDLEYLRYLFDLLSDLAEAYFPVVALGGEAVPFLKDMMASIHLKSIATEWLRAIARRTTEQLGDRSPQVLCPFCLTRYKARKVLLESSAYITYYGCRICGQSREFLEGRVVAVLDSRMDTERVQQDGTLRVNWLVRRALFDFDEVEIVQAPDEDVERFVVQVGNDTDDFRRSRYKKMACTIVSDCRLSENTLRILKSTFDEELRSTAQKQETLLQRSLESMIIPPPIQPEAGIRPPIRLRSEPLMVATDEFRDVFTLDNNRQPREYIRNDFEEQGAVVVDQVTGLIWQKSGSDDPLTYEHARAYIQQLHDERFADHDAWRLPTIEELMSLLEPERQTNGLYIKPIFDRRQPGCWSADSRSSESVWRIRFGYCDVHWHSLATYDYVRGVRSRE